MRRIAKDSYIKVHGVLWIFDQLVEKYIITDETQAYDKLTLLMTLNSRLPTSECKKRLKTWE